MNNNDNNNGDDDNLSRGRLDECNDWADQEYDGDNNDDENNDSHGTSLTEYGHKMRSSDLPAYLSLNGPSNGKFMLLMLFCSILACAAHFSEFQLVCD